MIISVAVLRARWVETEAVHLKRMGLSFDEIAEQITREGRGMAQPITPIPDGVSFPSEYWISRQACHKACRRALAREPALGVEELRKIDHALSEDMLMNLQPAIRKGNVRAIETGIKVLEHSLKVHGYGVNTHVNVQLENGIPIAAVREVMAFVDAEDAAVVQGTSAGPTVPSPAVSPAPAADGVTSPNGGSLELGEEVPVLSFQIDLGTPRALEELRKELDDETNE
jgi:hypothetical protein